MTIAFPSLGVQCIKKKEIEEALMLRQEIRVDPFQSESLILHANSQQAENECDCGNPIPPPSLFPLPVPRMDGWREEGRRGQLQGSAKRLRPGLVNMRRKYCVLLPAAGRRMQFFLLIFSKPGRSLFAEPCTLYCEGKCN